MKRAKSIILMLIVLILISFSTISIEASVNYKKIYKEYAKQLQKKSSTTLCMAILNSDQPMLLICDIWPSQYTSKGCPATSCQVYQYVKSKKKVVYIGKFYSGGTGQPLCKKGKYLLGGTHHNARRLKAKNGKATVDAVYNVWLTRKCEYIKWSVTNDTWKKIKTKKVSEKKGKQLYYKYYCIDEVLYFKKIS